MSKRPDRNLLSLLAVAITLLGWGVNKAEAQSQSTVGCPHCNDMRETYTIPEGVFKFDGRPAVYYSNGRGQYCWYDSWNSLVRLTGQRKPKISIMGRTLRYYYNMRYAGICTGGVSRPAPHPDPDF